jgi:hypothetical protein
MAAYTQEQVDQIRRNLRIALDARPKVEGAWKPDWSLHEALGLELPTLPTLTELTAILKKYPSSYSIYTDSRKSELWTPYINKSITDAWTRKAEMGDSAPAKKVFTALGGTSATGKSSLRKARFAAGPSIADSEADMTGVMELLFEMIPYDGVVVDPDDAKLVIPEFQAHLKHQIPGGASFAHEESRELAESLRIKAFSELRENIIYDTSGQFNKGNFLPDMLINGYETNGIFYFSDIDAAIERAEKRAEEKGRSVPKSIIVTIQNNLIRMMNNISGEMNRLVLVDSTDIDNPSIMLDMRPSNRFPPQTGPNVVDFIDEDLLKKYFTGDNFGWWN